MPTFYHSQLDQLSLIKESKNQKDKWNGMISAAIWGGYLLVSDWHAQSLWGEYSAFVDATGPLHSMSGQSQDPGAGSFSQAEKLVHGH